MPGTATQTVSSTPRAVPKRPTNTKPSDIWAAWDQKVVDTRPSCSSAPYREG